MPAGEIRVAIAAAGTYKIKKTAGKRTEITELIITANVAGSITISDGAITDTIYLGAGVNTPFEHVLVYETDNDITITAVTSNVSVYGHYHQA